MGSRVMTRRPSASAPATATARPVASAAARSFAATAVRSLAAAPVRSLAAVAARPHVAAAARSLAAVACIATAPLLVLVTPTEAQTLASRIAGVRDGKVRLSFAARPGVCGHGRSINFRSDDFRSDNRDWESTCEPGPVRVALTLDDGEVSRIRTYVGGRWRPTADGTDFGTVPSAEAADYLLGLAERLDTPAADDAVLPATLAAGTTVWPRLLGIARDRSRASKVRKSAVFWLGQEAAAAATDGLAGIVDDRAEDREIRKSAVFALSQRPDDESVPVLIRIARTHPDPEIRKSALFWLAQSDDPRVIDLFEELLIGG